MHLCGDSGLFDFAEACVRKSWAAAVPALFVFILCVFSVPIPSPVRKLGSGIPNPFEPFMTLHEAEALDASSDDKASVAADADGRAEVLVKHDVPLWRTLLLSWLALLQVLVWLAVGAYSLATDGAHLGTGVCYVAISASWVYAVCKPVFWPKQTAHLDLFIVYAAHFVFGVLMLGGVIFEHKKNPILYL